MTRLYHFTSIYHLPVILRAGYLRTTDPNLFPGGPSSKMNMATGEIITEGPAFKGAPVVWLLDAPDTDLGHGLSLGGGVDKTAVRFTVEVPKATRWLDWIQTRPYDPLWVNTIIETGGGMAAAEHWWVTTRRIPSDQWVAINFRDGVVLPEGWADEPTGT